MLFLDFTHKRLGKLPTALRLADIEPDLILAFLDHLEQQRQNSVRSRNLRLAGLRAFLKFAARRDVSSLHVIERALGVPMKRFEQPMLGFPSRDDKLAVIGRSPVTTGPRNAPRRLAPSAQHRREGLGDHRRPSSRRGSRGCTLCSPSREGP